MPGGWQEHAAQGLRQNAKQPSQLRTTLATLYISLEPVASHVCDLVTSPAGHVRQRCRPPPWGQLAV